MPKFLTIGLRAASPVPPLSQRRRLTRLRAYADQRILLETRALFRAF
jgi:hypothetical protein